MRDAATMLSDITELLDLVEDRPLRKGATPHGEVKAEHHEKMAEYHGRMEGLHARMAEHYRSGASGAHEAGGSDEEHDGDEGDEHTVHEDADADVAALEKRADDEVQLRILRAKARDGDRDARLKLDTLARAEIRKALRVPYVAVDATMCGRRGHPMANLEG